MLSAKARWSQSTGLDRLIRWCAAAIGLAIGLLCFAHSLPPLFDWPNHFARHYVQAQHLLGRPSSPFYEVAYALMPNLGSELLVPPLIVMLGPEVASALYLTLVCLLVWAGAALFILQYGNYTTSAQCAALLLAPWILSSQFFVGLINSFSGLGVALLVTTHFIYLARKPDRKPHEMVLHAALVCLLYLWHLTALGVYAVITSAFSAERLLKSSRDNRGTVLWHLVWLHMTALPAVQLAAVLSPSQGANALQGGISWSPPLQKLLIVTQHFRSYSLLVDGILVSAWVIAVALMYRAVHVFRPQLDYVGIALVAFLFLLLAMPHQIGTTFLADMRMMLPLFVLAVALLAKAEIARTALFGLALLSAVSFGRLLHIHQNWTLKENGAQQLVKKFSTSISPPRILTVYHSYGWREFYEAHTPSWLVVSKGAYVSSLYAIPGQHALRHTYRPFREFKADFVTDRSLLLNNAARIAEFYDYVWICDPGGKQIDIPSNWTVVLSTRESRLVQVRQ